MTELAQVRLHPDGVWAISPREGVMNRAQAHEIMAGLRDLEVRGIVLMAPVRVAPLSYERLIEAARAVVDVDGHDDFAHDRMVAINNLSDVLDELDLDS